MEKQKVIFFTGAGISVDSGIPTFQEQPDFFHRGIERAIKIVKGGGVNE